MRQAVCEWRLDDNQLEWHVAHVYTGRLAVQHLAWHLPTYMLSNNYPPLLFRWYEPYSAREEVFKISVELRHCQTVSNGEIVDPNRSVLRLVQLWCDVIMRHISSSVHCVWKADVTNSFSSPCDCSEKIMGSCRIWASSPGDGAIRRSECTMRRSDGRMITSYRRVIDHRP